jgi:HSP90 family molecular chaperone
LPPHFKEYVDRMKEGQNDIYNIKGETVAAVSSSPFLEALRKKGLEVLYVCDPVDEYAITQLKELDGKTLESCAKEGLDCLEERTKRRNAEIEGLKQALLCCCLGASTVAWSSASSLVSMRTFKRDKVAKLLRYQTSKSGDESISFKEYVDRMKEGRNEQMGD